MYCTYSGGCGFHQNHTLQPCGTHTHTPWKAWLSSYYTLQHYGTCTVHVHTLEGVVSTKPHLKAIWRPWKAWLSTYHTTHVLYYTCTYSGGCGFLHTTPYNTYIVEGAVFVETKPQSHREDPGRCGFLHTTHVHTVEDVVFGKAWLYTYIHVHVPHPTTLYTQYIPGFGHVLL